MLKGRVIPIILTVYGQFSLARPFPDNVIIHIIITLDWPGKFYPLNFSHVLSQLERLFFLYATAHSVPFKTQLLLHAPGSTLTSTLYTHV